MLIRITAPYFVAGYDYPTRVAPIIKYMMGWNLATIFDYCRQRRWEIEIIEEK